MHILHAFDPSCIRSGRHVLGHAGHYILQMEELARHSQAGRGVRLPQTPRLQQQRQLPGGPHSAEAPKFRLAGIAVGDGLTDPLLQVTPQAWRPLFMDQAHSPECGRAGGITSNRA